MRRVSTVFIQGLFGCLLLVPAAPAQTVATAQISGNVTDPTGAAVAGVEVSVAQTETGFTRTVTSNESGFYVLANLPIGPYRLQAAYPSFRTHVQNGIVLEVHSSPVLDITLELGAVTETVQVQANT